MNARRFFLSLIAILAIVVAIDLAIGLAGDYLVGHAKGGDTGRHEYINRHMTEPVVVMGSSRASHHYDPRILADSLGKPAYNAGADGNGIVHAYMQLTNILSRYKPEIIIYDFYGQYDYSHEPDLTTYLTPQRSYYGRGNDALDSVFHAVDSSERLKMLSGAYRYNSRFVQLLSDNLKPQQQNIMGYVPLENTGMELHRPSPWPSHDIDALKLEYLRRFAEKCHDAGTSLFMVVSPYYFPTEDPQIPAKVAGIFRTYGVVLLDYSADPEFAGERRYWSDTNHLSEDGAAAFTRRVASDIKCRR